MLDRILTLLNRAIERPWKLLDEPWIMAQQWDHLLFVHWRVDPEALRPFVPPGLTIDTFDGSAWLSLVPMRMAEIHFRGMPFHIGADNFPEMNLRTYVRHQDREGIFFFSLDTEDDINVWVARNLFRLPYFKADLEMEDMSMPVRFSSRRLEPEDPRAEVRVSYQPIGPSFHPKRDSLDYFLGERYAMYSLGPGGALMRGEIDHEEWDIQPAEADFEINTMIEATGIPILDVPPVLRYARTIDVVAWPMLLVDGQEGSR
jgi:uncharacterized protein YqjF (DUF2071 family)